MHQVGTKIKPGKDVLDHGFGHAYHPDPSRHVETEYHEQQPELGCLVGSVYVDIVLVGGTCCGSVG